MHILTVGTRERKKKLDCWSGVYAMNIGYRFFSEKFPLNMHANIGWFFLLFGETDIWLNGIIWCNYFSSGKKNVKNNRGYCYFWRFLSINSGEDCLVNQPFLFLLTTSSACGWCRSNFLSKGNFGQYCEFLSQHIVFSCQPQL